MALGLRFIGPGKPCLVLRDRTPESALDIFVGLRCVDGQICAMGGTLQER
jgi:hypothetical protein